ncbi:MAG: hypothetical protein IIA87_05040 [Nanoarchaeota archaeon]|nr:hypothetical protein [Nanoarchaeota archaeon]
MRTKNQKEKRNRIRARVGNLIGDLMVPHAEFLKNNSAVVRGIKEGTLSGEKYTSFLAAIYPTITGFNRGLIRNLAKVDHVKDSGLIKKLAEQLIEEQAHNGLWRHGLNERGINHMKLHDDFEGYLGRFSQEELDQMLKAYLEAISKDGSDLTPGVFPKPVFPEPVIALEHQLRRTSSPEHDFYEHFGSQYAIEGIIYNVVSDFYDGLERGEQFKISPHATRWFFEHAAQNEGSDEEKHLSTSQVMLNRSNRANEIKDKVLEQVEYAAKLFAATISWHDKNHFDIGEYKI